jgi:hypothetical protein
VYLCKDLLSTLYRVEIREVACSIGEMLSISIKLVFFYTMTELSQICPKTMSHFFIQYLPDTIQNSIESRTLDEKGEK